MATTLFGPPLDPASNPFAHPSFFDLNFNPTLPDDVILTPGLLQGYLGGLRALDGDDTVVGSTDGEIVNGNVGKDRLFGRAGADTFRGGQNEDEVYGEEGNDVLNGNRGQDFVEGGIGNDLVRGGQDEDLLIGGEGDDTLIGDFGQDGLVGGPGNDVFVLRHDTGVATALQADLLVDFDAASDRIGLTGGLTEANLILQPFRFPVGPITEQSLEDLIAPTGLEISPQAKAIIRAYINPEKIDPNGDGFIEGTLISNGGIVLGAALNSTTADLAGHFVTVPDSLLGLG